MAWLGTFDTRQGRVLLIMGEEDRDEVHRRVFRTSRAMNAPPIPAGSIEVIALHGVECAMLARAEYGNVVEAPFLLWLRDLLQGSTWDLIVIDPLSRFAGPDAERDNA